LYTTKEVIILYHKHSLPLSDPIQLLVWGGWMS